MKFSRIGEHTIKCTITEQEIGDLGYTIDEVLTMDKKKFIADAKRYIGCTVDDVLKKEGQKWNKRKN